MEEYNNVSDKQDKIISFLKEAKVEFIDKRDKGGSLWVIGGLELVDVLTEARELGYYFKFSKEGSRATKNKPGWWTKNK